LEVGSNVLLQWAKVLPPPLQAKVLYETLHTVLLPEFKVCPDWVVSNCYSFPIVTSWLKFGGL